MTTDQIRRLIRDAGREPCERDTLYNVIRRESLQALPESPAVPSAAGGQ